MSGERNGTAVADWLDGDRPPSLTVPGEQESKEAGPWLVALLPAALLVTAAAAVAGGFSLLRSHHSSWLAPAAFVTGSFIFVSSAAVLFGIIREKHIEAEEKKACRNDCRDLYWSLDDIGVRAVKGLTWINFKQLRVFAAIAQRQARMSYYASLAAAAISLLVLSSGATVAIALPTTTAKITAGSLAAAGTALTGFLVKTFLRSYQMASRQMSYYYGQPLVHCYLLHAEWLAVEGREEYGDEEGRILLQKVIDACIKAGTDAQDHLLSMQEHAMDKPGTRSRRTGRDGRSFRLPGQAPGSVRKMPNFSGAGPGGGDTA